MYFYCAGSQKPTWGVAPVEDEEEEEDEERYCSGGVLRNSQWDVENFN